MPYTKRKPHYGSPKELLEYALDKEHSGEKVAEESSINCNIDTALLEFVNLQKKYNMDGNRVCYHVIQSFSPLDKITPKEANEIGKKLCEELYPDYQCVICTHIDRGHIHNHIAINAINLKGKKLEDRLANKKEGLYGLREASDKISAEYGCYIMPKSNISVAKHKNYYYHYKSQTWREKIKDDLDNILPISFSMDEFLEHLSLKGYKVKKGKYISVKGIGMKKFSRLTSINKNFTTQNLYRFFKIQNGARFKNTNIKETKFNKQLLSNMTDSQLALEKSSLATEGNKYSEYQKTKYLEIKRYYRLKTQLEFLNKYDIHSFNSLEKAITDKRQEIKDRNISLKSLKKAYGNISETIEKAHDYIKLYRTYEYAMSYKKLDSSYTLPKEVKAFLEIQNELKITSVKEANKLIKLFNEKRIIINKQKNLISNLQKELNDLDSVKEEVLSASNLYIHNIKFGANRINYKLSNDDVFCVNLPYTHETLRIPKNYTAYNSKHGFYTLFLVDDKKYTVFDEENKKVKEYTGKELEQHVLDKKKEIDKSYNN